MTQPDSLVLEKHPDEELFVQDETVSAPESAPDTEAIPSDETPTLAAQLVLDRANLHKEIARLEREDPDFANAFNTAVGRKASRQYQSRLDELTIERDSYKKAIRRQELMGMPAAEVNSRFQSDPVFAKEYSELVHHDPNEVAQQLYLVRLVEETEKIFDYGMGLGLTPERADEIRKEIGAGKYSNVTDQQALLQLQRDIWAEVNGAGQSAPSQTQTPTQSQAPAPQQQRPLSPALTGGPDMSPAGGASDRGKPKYTGSQITAMDPEQFIAEFPNDSDYDIAVREGRVDFNK